MPKRSSKGALATVAVLTLVVCLGGGSWVRQHSTGSAQLVSIEQLPLA
jgi:hypothetical protein